MLKGKHVLLGVTGGIASYKIATLASLLVKAQADVHVIMTETGTLNSKWNILHLPSLLMSLWLLPQLQM